MFPDTVFAVSSSSLEAVLIADRFELLKYTSRSGAWGTVHKAVDRKMSRPGKEQFVGVKKLNPTEIALEQMVERGLSPGEVIDKEELPVHNYQRLVPRQLFSHEGETYVIMPWVDKFLSDKSAPFVNYATKKISVDIDGILSFAEDVSIGLNEFFEVTGRAHGDLKPDNVAFMNGMYLVNDFGSSTIEASKSFRENMGGVGVRAPEVFKPNGRPSSQSDVWSLGSNMYRLATGKFIFEDELSTDKQYLASVTEKEYNSKLQAKLKQLPKRLRPLLSKMLTYDSLERLALTKTTAEIKELKNLNTVRGQVAQYLERASKTIKIALILGGVTLGFVGASRYLVKDANTSHVVHHEAQTITVGSNLLFDKVEFEAEKIVLPDVLLNGVLVTHPSDFNKDLHLRHKTVPFSKLGDEIFHPVIRDLTSAYRNAIDNLYAPDVLFPDGFSVSSYVTEEDFSPDGMLKVQMFLHAHLTNYLVDSTNKEPIDLENFMVDFVLGEATRKQAMATSGQTDYANYALATASGKRIIPQKDKEFIDRWSAYVRSQ